jgi:hypothetical protein
MKAHIALLALVFLAGCATHDTQTIARVRASGVSERTVAKLERGGPLTPENIIELKKRHVPDEVILRQLDEVGVNYVVTTAEKKQLRAAGVSADIVDALVSAGNRFAAYRNTPPVYFYGDYDYYPRYYYGAPWWIPHGNIGLGYTWGGHRHHRYR